jgi:hypothetical protein
MVHPEILAEREVLLSADWSRILNGIPLGTYSKL